MTKNKTLMKAGAKLSTKLLQYYTEKNIHKYLLRAIANVQGSQLTNGVKWSAHLALCR